ncbi:thiol reductant ABC exporter subunit CydD [Mycetocola reblochoni]|uniref:thiol reductant ABC exporter subunit CydD n=1 Tax=Mycetocola reblochoni TaxID=331618 RepID=UPI003F98DFBF
MRPLDPRLLRYAAGARWFFAAGAVLAALQTVLTIAFAWSLSQAIVGVVEGRSLAELRTEILVFAGTTIARLVVTWASGSVSIRGAARVKSELRSRLYRAIGRLGPAWSVGRSSAGLTVLGTRGLDALDDYFGKYLPQLILTVIATPVIVAVMFWQDVLSGVFVVVTLPLIPVFMVLIGWATQSVQRQQWDTLSELSGNYLDVLGGLSTLKSFGRAERQLTRIRVVTERYRVATMKVLRTTFLSGFALELGASLSVALVAVGVGMRLVAGDIGFGPALFVLLLAPEAFLPLRNVGTNFHAAAEGVTASEDVFAILDEAADAADATATAVHPGGGASSAATAPAGLEFHDVGVSYDGTTVLSGVSARFAPGRVGVLTGPSGSGKSSLISTLLGTVAHDGVLTLDGSPLPSGPGERPWLAWSGQRPGLISGTVADNVSLGEASVDPDRLTRALALAQLDGWDADRECGVAGSLLSGGQAQRVAVARAFYRALRPETRVLVLDEPSSALDHETERRLAASITELAAGGLVVIVASHRRRLRDIADVELALTPAVAKR